MNIVYTPLDKRGYMIENIIFNEDCLSGMERLPEGCIDMVLCDPPFEQTHNNWDTCIPLDPLWQQIKRITKSNAAIIFFANGMFTARLMMSNPKWWRYNLIWEKTQPSGFLNANRMPLRAHEDICVFYNKLPIYNPQKTTGHTRKVSTANHKRNSKLSTDYNPYEMMTYDSTERYPRSVLKFSKDTQKSALHPTQKPVALCEWLIRSYTNENDIVLDMCMGSGTTAVAAMNCGRRYIGFELDEGIYKTACERIHNNGKELNKK